MHRFWWPSKSLSGLQNHKVMVTPRASPSKLRKWAWSPTSSNRHRPVPRQSSFSYPAPTCSSESPPSSFHCSCQTMPVSWNSQCFQPWRGCIVLRGCGVLVSSSPTQQHETDCESVTCSLIGKKQTAQNSFCQHNYGTPRRVRDVSKVTWVGKILGREDTWVTLKCNCWWQYRRA